MRRIVGELRKLALTPSRGTVRRVLEEEGLLPDPNRHAPKGVDTPWRTFLPEVEEDQPPLLILADVVRVQVVRMPHIDRRIVQDAMAGEHEPQRQILIGTSPAEKSAVEAADAATRLDAARAHLAAQLDTARELVALESALGGPPR